MKKIVFALFISVLGFSQENFTTYDCTALEKKYDVSVSKDKKNEISFWIEAKTYDTTSKSVKLILKGKETIEFKEYLNALKVKFNEWSEVAKKNEVVDFRKDFEYKNLTFSSAFSYGKWQFDFSTNISAYFTVIKSKPFMIIRSDELQSSSNQFMKNSGLLFYFQKNEDFDSLLNALDEEKAIKMFNDKEQKETLFKD